MPSLVLEPASLVITRASDSIVVRGRVGGAAASDLRLTLLSETRAMPLLPVLAGDALGRRVLVPRGPGSARLVARTPEAPPETLTVRVEPDVPTVFAATSTANGTGTDTLILRGMLLQGVADGAVRVGGVVAPIVAKAAGELRVLAPTLPAEGCAGTAPTAALTMDGGAVARGVGARVPRAGELRLDVGEWRLLSAAEAACIRLPAAQGEYALAFADLRQVERGRAEWAGLPTDAFTVTVSDRSREPAVALRGGTGTTATAPLAGPVAMQRGASAHDGVTCSQEEFIGFTFWCRSTPWRVGDRLRIRRPLATPPDTVWATVNRVYDGRFVFAKIDGDSSPALMSFVDTIDAAMPVFLQTGVPVLRHALGNAYPVTSAGSGQLLTIIGDFVGGRASWGCCHHDIGISNVVVLGSSLGGSLPRVVHLLTHEFTHGWQQRWFHDSRPPEALAFEQGPLWAVEGGADLLTHEVIRRWSGVPWRANLLPVWPSTPRPLSAPWHAEALASGELPAGYHQASSFLRDIVARAVEAGVPMEVAYREVARGALEDWFGHDEGGARRMGLAGRMRATFDPAWEPRAALLGYALAQTADERTTVPGLHNPFFQLPAALARAGFGVTVLTGGTGEAFTARRGASHLGSVWLHDAGAGASFAAGADRPNVAWAIARTR